MYDVNKQIEIVKTLVPQITNEIITIHLPDNYTMTIQKIQIHKLGNVEIALEYKVSSPDGKQINSIFNLPEFVDDVREDILRAASNSMKVRKSDNGMIPYMVGRITDLEKRDNVYKSKNAWARGF